MLTLGRALHCYYPGKGFPSFSVTGEKCALHCDHCHGHYLHGMKEVSTPEALIRAAQELSSRGGRGFLLSGGCDQRGRVPLLPFVEAVRQAKERYGLEVNIHTGMLDLQEAKSLVRSRADCYSVDVHQTRNVIQEVLHSPMGPEDYEDTLVSLFDAGAEGVVPHVTVGLEDGNEDAMESIRLSARYPIRSLVLLVFLPTPGTPLQDRQPPADEEVLRAIKEAVMLARCPVILGCMRPRGRPRLEREAILLGVRHMAMPSPATVEWAVAEGFDVLRAERCCALQV